MGVWTWLRRRKPKAEAAEAVVALAEPEPERRLLTSKWDPAEVKKALDECFARALLDAGYAEDHHVGNTKAGLGVATCAMALRRCATGLAVPPLLACPAHAPPALPSCATALLAQFYPVPFPRNYWLLTACCVVYFVLNSVLQARRRGRAGSRLKDVLHSLVRLQAYSVMCERDVVLATLPGDDGREALALSSRRGIEALCCGRR